MNSQVIEKDTVFEEIENNKDHYVELYTKYYWDAKKEFSKDKLMSKNGLTRDYYREFVKSKGLTEIGYGLIWSTFTELKKDAESMYDRDNINIKKEGTHNGKKYLVSSIIQGAQINTTFFDSLITYCNKHGAELVLLTMRGVNVKDYYGPDIFEKYGQYFVTEYKFNNNLMAKDFILNPQQIVPTTGLTRFGKKDFSLIIASPKQFLNVVPTKKDAVPHIIYTTGTVCEPTYRDTRQGAIADQDNELGALVVEVVSKTKFHIRNVLFDGTGFSDLNYHYSNKIKSIKAEAVVCGDIHCGQEDPVAIKATKEQIKLLQPKQVFLHDVLDGQSVSHHIENDMIARLHREKHQKTLANELTYTHSFLKDFIKDCGNRTYNIVASNHDLFLSKYLTQRRFVHDEINIVLACKLFVEMAEGSNPVEAYFNNIIKEPLKKLKFLKLGESIEIDSIECASHGDLGNNGARGSVQSLEYSYGSITAGHSHSPTIYRGVYIAGCNCNLVQNYNIGGGSSWMHANVIHYKGGYRQMLLINDGEWKI